MISFEPSVRRRLLVPLLSLALLAPILLAGSANGKAATGVVPVSTPAFVVQSQTEIPADLHAAVDIRWASDKTVYLALSGAGVVEAPLMAGQTAAKEVIAGKRKVGGLFLAYHVAASNDYLAAAPPIYLVSWRRLNDPTRREEPFEYVQAIDVREHRLAILGVRSDEQRNFSPDGAIGWVGSLDNKLADLKPIAFSATGPGATAAMACSPMGLGALRFLADGSLLVIPGTQAGVTLLDPHGKPLRAWDTATLGIDTDCANVTPEQHRRMSTHISERLDWLNQRRTVDSILPLPQGVGVLVRIPEKAATHWELKLLRLDGTWAAVSVPLRGESAYAHLRADARGGRIVLLLYEEGWGIRPVAKTRLITAALDS
jgi:hypothetical protein